MRILLVAATPTEIAPTVTWLRNAATAQERDVLTFPRVQVQVTFTGLGPVRTAFALGHLLGQATPQLALQAGVAGAVDRVLKIGQVVNVISEALLDDGAEDRDGSLLSLPDIGFPYGPPFGADGTLSPVGPSSILPYPTVHGGTVARASGSAERIALLRKHFPQVQVETMEGAAFFHACLSTGIDALQLRAISNYVTPRDRDAWNMPLAITNLNTALQRVLTPFVAAAAT